MDCSPPGSSVHGISQARILKWVAISFFRGSSVPGIEPTSPVSPALAGGVFCTAPPGKPFLWLLILLKCMYMSLSSYIHIHKTSIMCIYIYIYIYIYNYVYYIPVLQIVFPSLWLVFILFIFVNYKKN
ncbi:unnamed protein product [Rangifer tarandus platyrhynchus]|uniref:Uncharacterized protein n=1 Tax=Rangifer tarandus platyrhynchus TaxID=3082113 RepID=A0AC59ZI45_RANTA